MAQRSHVPKFGNWDSDNVPYTTYFENARKERASGVKMNPNDPEENPEAFMGIGGSPENNDAGHAHKTSLQVGSDKSMPAEKHHIEGHTGYNNAHRRNPSDHQKSRSRKSINTESGSDKSSSDYSLVHANQRHKKSERRKTLAESSNSFAPSLPGSTRSRSGNHPSVDGHHRVASVPKFGAWDETDPRSGEGFTVIFNRVKEEKQSAATQFPALPPQPSNYSKSQKKHESSSCLSNSLFNYLFVWMELGEV